MLRCHTIMSTETFSNITLKLRSLKLLDADISRFHLSLSEIKMVKNGIWIFLSSLCLAAMKRLKIYEWITRKELLHHENTAYIGNQCGSVSAA